MGDAVLEVQNLVKSFGALKATDDVSLDLQSGEIHALIGPNGAGKSTLIKQIVGEIAPTSGAVWLQGQDISTMPAPDRARAGLARSFQVSSIIPEFTVLQNVMLAAQGASGVTFRFFRPAMKDAALVGTANDCLTRVGLNARAGVRASDLSHGERRSLEVAMALALRPKVFLLDEPMAGMGTEGANRLIALLSNLKAEAPILLIEHDMDAVFALADRISVLVYGRIIATGSVDEIKAHAEVRSAYLGDE